MLRKLVSLFVRLVRMLPAPRAWVELRCARRLDRLARRLQGMHARIAGMQDHLLCGDTQTPPASDADGSLRRMLAGLRAELARMRAIAEEANKRGDRPARYVSEAEMARAGLSFPGYPA